MVLNIYLYSDIFLLFKSDKTYSTSGAIPGLGKSVDTQTRQEELLNSTTRITTLDSILVSFLSTIAHCMSQWNPSSTRLSLPVYHRASTSGKTQIIQNLVQLYSSGLCMEEIFVIVA